MTTHAASDRITLAQDHFLSTFATHVLHGWAAGTVACCVASCKVVVETGR